MSEKYALAVRVRGLFCYVALLWRYLTDTGPVVISQGGLSRSLTCHSDLVGGTGFAGQHLELLCLVHGVVSTGDDQRVPGLPRPNLVLQGQDGAVHVGVDGDGEFGPH